MEKKSFDRINTGKADTGATAGAVYESIERGEAERGQQGAASPEEQATRAAELRTQGRKGCKTVRINFAFTPENHDFVRTVGTATGQGMTRFLNQIIDEYRASHASVYEQSKKLLEQIQGAGNQEK